jgi:hypothetical protein
MATPNSAPTGGAGAPATRPAARYGDGRGSTTRATVLGSIAVVLAVAALAWIYFGRAASADPVSGDLIGYDHVSPTDVSARVSVSRPAGVAAVCILRTLDSSGTEVGRVTDAIPAGAETTLVRTVHIRSLAPARTAELVTCRRAAAPPDLAPTLAR